MGADLILYQVVGKNEYDFSELKPVVEDLAKKMVGNVDLIHQVYMEGLEPNDELSCMAKQLWFDSVDDTEAWLSNYDVETTVKVAADLCALWPNLGRDTC